MATYYRVLKNKFLTLNYNTVGPIGLFPTSFTDLGYPLIYNYGVIHLRRPQENPVFDSPRPLSTSVHMRPTSPTLCGRPHLVDMKIMHFKLLKHTTSAMTFRAYKAEILL